MIGTRSIVARLACAMAILAGVQVQVAPTAAYAEVLMENGAASADAARPVISGSDVAVDESALRYYALLKQTARVEAEIRRLKHFHPAWSVPTDLYTAQAGNAQEEALWALFSSDRIADLRAAVDARMAADPNWHPSDDLARKLRGKEVRGLIYEALKAKRFHVAVEIAEAEARSIDIKDVQLRWDVADAYKTIHRTNKAFELLYSILATSQDPIQRLVTAQKAISFLPMADAEKLIGMAKTGPDGRSEFEPIAMDIARARMSAFLHDEVAREVTAADLEALQGVARAAEDPDQSGLLAWYYYKRGDLQNALEWFKWSLGHGGDSMIAHGLAHTLRRLGMLRETEEVAFAWRGPLINNSILFIDILERDLTKQVPPFIEPARLARYAQVTMASQSGEGAQALAWYSYNSCQYDTALNWFRRAVAWLPKEATVYGYALTLQRLKKKKEYFDLVNRYDGLFPKVVEMVFPDGLYHPPGRCDPQPAGRHDEPPLAQAAETPSGTPGLRYLGEAVFSQPVNATRRAGAATAPPDARRTPYARVPSPDLQNAMAATSGERVPVFKRDEFPIAVRGENDLRFDGSEQRPESSGSTVAEVSPLIPLTARRVPGVTTMPYEKWGFALLPGWNGVEGASETAATRLPPAAGTAWATEIAADGAMAQGSGLQTTNLSTKSDPTQSRLP